MSANILIPSSDKKRLAGGGAEGYRHTPAGGSPPELAIAPSAFLRPTAAAHILMVDNKKAAAISSRDSPCLHLLRSIKRVLPALNQQIDCLLDAFFFRNVVFFLIIHTGNQIFGNDDAHCSVDAGSDCGQLRHDVGTILSVFHHGKDTTHLSFRTLNAVDYIFVVLIHTTSPLQAEMPPITFVTL